MHFGRINSPHANRHISQFSQILKNDHLRIDNIKISKEDFKLLDEISKNILRDFLTVYEKLQEINKEGLEGRWQRHLNMADYSRKWALERGQAIFPDRVFESSTITSIRNDQEWDIKQITEKLLERGYSMDMGYGKLKGRAFRIAHMGNIMMDDLVDYLNNFDEVIFV